MDRKLVVHPRADLDQVEAFAYFAGQSPDAARRFLDAVEAAFRTINANPNAGHRYINAHRPNEDWRYLRLTGFKKYFVFYRIVESQTEVVRILHGSRDLDNILRIL